LFSVDFFWGLYFQISYATMCANPISRLKTMAVGAIVNENFEMHPIFSLSA
jgi:hypothetical protein